MVKIFGRMGNILYLCTINVYDNEKAIISYDGPAADSSLDESREWHLWFKLDVESYRWYANYFRDRGYERVLF